MKTFSFDLAQLRQAESRYFATRIGRRALLGKLGAVGLGAVAAPLAIRSAAAESTGGHSAHMGMAQESQEGTPPAPATPVLGAQADGSTVWKVIAGGGNPAEGIDLLAYFPANITVNVGDAVYWEIRGFHNIHFLSGAPIPEEIIPDPAATVEAGAPPPLILNPQVAFPSGGTAYDGTGEVNTGLPLDPAAPPFVISFTAAGTFDYYCTLHGETMKGTVTVQEAGSAYPMDQAAADAAGAAEAEALMAQAMEVIAQAGAATPMADGATAHHVIVGLSAPQLEINQFIPRELTVKAGDVVRFVNQAVDPDVPHTVTFAGGEEAPAFIVPEPQAGGPPKIAINAVLVAPAGPSLPDAYNGEGFANSGLLGGAPDAPRAMELAFDTAGTYRYYCAVHGDPEGGMIGDITVEAAG